MDKEELEKRIECLSVVIEEISAENKRLREQVDYWKAKYEEYEYVEWHCESQRKELDLYNKRFKAIKEAMKLQ